MPKTLITKIFVESLKSIKNKLSLLALSVLIDFSFIFTIGFFIQYFATKIYDHMIPMLASMQQSEAEITEALMNQEKMMALLETRVGFMPHYNAVIQLIIIAVIVLFVLYVIFQGINWKLADKIAKKRINFLNYIAKFSLLSLIWYILVLAVGLFFVKFAFNAMTAFVAPIIGYGFIKWISILFLIIICYFAFISYALISKEKIKVILKKTFVLGYKRAKEMISAYIIIALLFFIVNLILRLTFKINPVVMFLVGVIVALPLFCFTRVYIVKILKNPMDFLYPSGIVEKIK